MRSLLAFWMGGAAGQATTPPVVTAGEAVFTMQGNSVVARLSSLSGNVMRSS